MAKKSCIKVAVFSPIRGQFNYLPNEKDGVAAYQRGQRVVVPFRSSERVGVVIEISDNLQTLGLNLKKIACILDEKPILPINMIRLAEWASSYYHHPLGSAISNLLPPSLRKRNRYKKKQIVKWKISSMGKIALTDNVRLGKRQKQFLNILMGLGMSTLKEIAFSFPDRQIHQVARRLEDKGWIEKSLKSSYTNLPQVDETQMVQLNEEQSIAVSLIEKQTEDKRPIVLNGVTGTGKTLAFTIPMLNKLLKDKQAMGLTEIALLPGMEFARKNLSEFSTHVIERY